jgi:glycosyltransferase involved in cell wall biosynthesis
MTDLSVVLITKNQAWSVSRLIESVLEAISPLSPTEVTLVDSASSDETVELAKRYPISILRLGGGQPLSPAIGRYVGYKHAKGEYILFLDGDTRLVPGWLPWALRTLQENQRAGAVTGRVINLPTSAAAEEPTPPLLKNLLETPREVLWGSYGGGGAALYRHSVLEQVGTFNPYLCSDEEPELGLRIRQAGYRFLELDYPIVRHYNDAPVAFSTALSRRRRNFLLGIGQGARYHLKSKLLWPWLKERWWGPAATLWSAATLGTLLASLVARDSIWLKLWSLWLFLTLAGITIRKRSLTQGLVAIFNWLLMAEGFVRGLLRSPLAPETFQTNLEVIQEHVNRIEEARTSRSLSSVGTPPNRNSLPAAAPSH